MDTNTGLFTIPVDGTYYLGWNFHDTGAGGNAARRIYQLGTKCPGQGSWAMSAQGGKSSVREIGEAFDNHENESGSMVLYLEKNCVVAIGVHSGAQDATGVDFYVYMMG